MHAARGDEAGGNEYLREVTGYGKANITAHVRLAGWKKFLGVIQGRTSKVEETM